MVVAIWFYDIKDFNLFCSLYRLKRNEIIETSQYKGNITAILDKNPRIAVEWEKRKAKFLKELKGKN
jgi:hypothetical protein